ncbi:MAG TPA: four helix bundle protein, partial [Gemmatimonadaceae bacterium]
MFSRTDRRCGMQDYRKLKVWEKAHSVAIDIHRVAGGFPRRDGVAVTSQLRRAALSIPTNIAEGAGKGGDAEFRRYARIALGSASETTYHLLVARDLGLIDLRTHQELTSRITEVRRMLAGLLSRLDAPS